MNIKNIFTDTTWDNGKLDNLLFRIEDKQFGAITSLSLIYQNHKLIEKYFGGFQADMLHEAQSTTKSLVSMLVGIAIDKGFITDTQENIKQYFPEYAHLDWSNGKSDITIEDLLTMRAGLTWNETELSYSTMDNDANQLFRSEDWLKYALSKDMKFVPNTQFTYSSANPVLLSKIILESTNMPQVLFADKYLFEPLGIKKYEYPHCPTNASVLGDIYLKANDLAKLGVLMLNKGKWNAEKVISKSWILTSTAEQVSLDEEGVGYGYCWWRRIFKVNNQSFSCYYAWGYGGQHIFMFPEQELVIATTAQIYDITLAPEPFQIVEDILNSMNL